METNKPCKFDHNGECLICDCWPDSCAYERYLKGDYTYETPEEMQQMFGNTMTDEEMDAFLESIGGLENGYFTDREPIKDCGIFCVSNGWFPLIKQLIEDLIALGWDKKICQVKEKFGGLRFYIGAGSNEIHDRISQAENDSYNICERTGKPGELRRDLGWWVTLCEEEYQKELEKRKK